MSPPTEKLRSSILALASGKISRDAFFKENLLSEQAAMTLGPQMLDQAFAERDPIGVELGIYLGCLGVSEESRQALLRLATENWHQSHEPIVDILAFPPNSDTVDVLFSIAKTNFHYLAYDVTSSLGVKCIWALAAIGTERACARLIQLFHSGNKILRRNAKERLSDLASDGATPEIRRWARGSR